MVLAMDHKIKKRIIVLVPDCLAGNLELAHKVFWIALRERCDVLYFTLVDYDGEMQSVSRRMAAMNVATERDYLVVDSIFAGTDMWLTTLRGICHPEDQIVCHEEQIVSTGFIKTVPIAEYLHDTLNLPIISISGFYHPDQVQVRKWIREILAWLGFFAILVGFTLMEIHFNHLFQGPIGKLLLCILVTIEFGAIWVWNNIADH